MPEEKVAEAPTKSPAGSIRPRLNFSQCLEWLVTGKSCRRLEWEDARVFITMRDEKLMIWKPEDGRFHPLIVSEGDIRGEDWVLV